MTQKTYSTVIKYAMILEGQRNVRASTDSEAVTATISTPTKLYNNSGTTKLLHVRKDLPPSFGPHIAAIALFAA